MTRDAYHRQLRARRQAAIAAGDPIKRMEIAARDRWMCGICGGPIESEDELTVDHIIPISRGGEHVYSNVQAAHLECNVRKGNAIDGEQWIDPESGEWNGGDAA